MSFEVNLEADTIPINSSAPSPTRVRKFEMAAATSRSSRLSSPSKAGEANTSSTSSSANSAAPTTRESRFKQQTGGGGSAGNSNFVDFGKAYVRTPAQSEVASPQEDSAGSGAKGAGFGKSRFAAFASAEVTYVKGVHDEIQSVLNDELASTQDNGPKFIAMDLARLISKVMVNLNLQPTKDQPDQPINGPNSIRHWVSSSPPGEKPTMQELKSTISMQNVLVSELGKSMQKMTKHNADLVEYNKKLISERNSAVQARDDLLKLLSQEQDEKMQLLRENERLVSIDGIRELEKRRKIDERRSPYERQYFDEAAILDAAVDAFINAQKETATDDVEHEVVKEEATVEEDQDLTEDNIKSSELAALPHSEKIRYAADMISVANHAHFPSALKVVSKIQFQQNLRYIKAVS